MRKSPNDKPLNRLIHRQIEGSSWDERILFIDTDNKIREAIYPSEFGNGLLKSVRARLVQAGVLKAVVHISATVFGSPTGHGPRTSVVEYLPTGEVFTSEWRTQLLTWGSDQHDEALARTQSLFDDHEGEESPED